MQKIKKFKNTTRNKDKIYTAKLFIPLFLILMLVIVLILHSQTMKDSIKTYKNKSYDFLRLVPDSSLKMLNIFLLHAENHQFNLSEEFAFTYQEVEGIIYLYDQFPEGLVNSALNTLLGDQCQRMFQTLCGDVAEGVAKGGASHANNLLAAKFKNIESADSVNLGSTFSEISKFVLS